MELKKNNPLTFCNFCGKTASELLDMQVPLKRAHEHKTAICDLCVNTLHHDCDKNIKNTPLTPLKKIATEVKPHNSKLYSPSEILALLDRHVAGQSEAKMAISMAVSNHLRSHLTHQKKSNVLLLGPSGTGKTQMARALSEELEIPLYVHDATNLTTAGYAGKDVESILLNLLSLCKYDVSKAETAIVFIDEIDKKADRGPNSGEIGTNMVQDSLLKMIEGDKVTLNIKGSVAVINTAKILFICAGAFSGIKLEEKCRRAISVTDKTTQAPRPVNLREALQTFGMKPEFVRRFAIVTKTTPHTEESLSMILDGKENSILSRYKALYTSHGLELHLDDEFRKTIINNALKSALPVSELEQSFESFSQQIFFDPQLKDKFKVTLTTNGHVFNKRKKVAV